MAALKFKISPEFKRSACNTALYSTGSALVLAGWFHIAAHQYYEENNANHYNAELPLNTAVVTGENGRISYALEQLKNYEIRKLHISGVNAEELKKLGHAAQTDSILAYNKFSSDEYYLKNRITLDSAKNTKENARNIVRWAKSKALSKVGIVTGHLHMPRLAYHLEQQSKSADIEFVLHSVESREPSTAMIYWEYAALLKAKANTLKNELHEHLGTDNFLNKILGLEP